MRTTTIPCDAKNLFFLLPTAQIRLQLRSLASGSLSPQQLQFILVIELNGAQIRLRRP